MTRLLPFLLFLTSCASPPPSPTYEKGAYRPAPARAPAFSPTEDAPHTYGPERRPDVQPQPKYPGVPHTPQTRREPTIWQGGPRAIDEPGGETEFKFLEIPLPPMDDATDWRGRLPTRLCAGQLSAALDRTAIKDWALKLPKDLRRCIAAHMYHQCAANAEANNPKTPGWPQWGLAKDAAKRFMDAACTPEMLSSDDLATVERDVKKAWNTIGGRR